MWIHALGDRREDRHILLDCPVTHSGVFLLSKVLLCKAWSLNPPGRTNPDVSVTCLGSLTRISLDFLMSQLPPMFPGYLGSLTRISLLDQMCQWLALDQRLLFVNDEASGYSIRPKRTSLIASVWAALSRTGYAVATCCWPKALNYLRRYCY